MKPREVKFKQEDDDEFLSFVPEILGQPGDQFHKSFGIKLRDAEDVPREFIYTLRAKQAKKVARFFEQFAKWVGEK